MTHEGTGFGGDGVRLRYEMCDMCMWFFFTLY